LMSDNFSMLSGLGFFLDISQIKYIF